MNKRLISFCVLLMIVIMDIEVLATDRESLSKDWTISHASGDDMSCGIQSLQYILGLSSKTVDMEYIKQLTKSSKEGTSLLDLSKAAEVLGLETRGVRYSLTEESGNILTPLIAHVNNNHFIVIENKIDNKFKIIDLPNPPYLMNKEKLEKIWDGYALIFPKLVITKTNHPEVVFDHTDYDFGDVQQYDILKHIFTFLNTGNESLNIKITSTSCGCTAALLSKDSIPPGEEGEIEVTFNPGDKKGNFLNSVRLTSNDPKLANIELAISGVIVSEIVSIPSQVYFGEILQSEPVTKLVDIFMPQDKEIKINKVESSKNIISKIIEQKGNYSVEITAKVSKLGNFNEELLIHTNYERQPVLKIPVYGKVISDIELIPSQLFFGVLRPGDTKSKRFKIQSRNGKSYTLKQIKTDLKELTINAQTNVPLPYETEVSLTATNETITGSITLLFSEDIVLTIPCYALVYK